MKRAEALGLAALKRSAKNTMMKEEEFKSLSLLYSSVREDLKCRRQHEQQIFTWTASIQVTVVAVVLGSSREGGILLDSVWGKFLAVSAIGIFTYFSGSSSPEHDVLR